MTANDLDIICWNVRGLNSQARRSTVQQTLVSSSCHITCIQEMKLSSIDDRLALDVGGFRICSFTFLLAGGNSGTQGSILILWNNDEVHLVGITKRDFSLTATTAPHPSPQIFASPDPRRKGSDAPDPSPQGSALANLGHKGSDAPDPSPQGSISPDLGTLGRTHPTPRDRASPCSRTCADQ
uniref:Endonuclease/exonuclease/phosphatase domain-containing protein n=1 Tax=Setaria viridis TaxID=4556 RepID=A0A4U6VA27_SETVI|nr:hypothetical protein SEVIR_3G168900v2 [Setaria viridis]